MGTAFSLSGSEVARAAARNFSGPINSVFGPNGSKPNLLVSNCHHSLVASKTTTFAGSCRQLENKRDDVKVIGRSPFSAVVRFASTQGKECSSRPGNVAFPCVLSTGDVLERLCGARNKEREGGGKTKGKRALSINHTLLLSGLACCPSPRQA